MNAEMRSNLEDMYVNLLSRASSGSLHFPEL
jgi:hypothetical protein